MIPPEYCISNHNNIIYLGFSLHKIISLSDSPMFSPQICANMNVRISKIVKMNSLMRVSLNVLRKGSFQRSSGVRCAAFATSTKHITSLNLEDDFHKIADESLERLSDLLAPLEDDDDVELELSMGVLKLKLSAAGESKSWVINKQTPNRQLWWSSPISGPRRYEWHPSSDSSDLAPVRNWTHTRAVAVPGGNNGGTTTAAPPKGEGDLLNQIHQEILSVTGIDLLKE